RYRIKNGSSWQNPANPVVTTQANATKVLQAFNFDSDPAEELFVVVSSPDIAWYDWNGSSWQQRFVIQNAGTPRDAKLVDLNADGFVDIVTLGVGFVKVYLGTGLGSFATTPITLVSDASTLSNPSTLVVADFDNDGDLDISY